MTDRLPRLLIFIPAYEAARHIERVISRIPKDLDHKFETHVLVIDDASSDATSTLASRALEKRPFPYTFNVLANPRNRGYGGNQKLGYAYAVEEGFDDGPISSGTSKKGVPTPNCSGPRSFPSSQTFPSRRLSRPPVSASPTAPSSAAAKLSRIPATGKPFTHWVTTRTKMTSPPTRGGAVW